MRILTLAAAVIAELTRRETFGPVLNGVSEKDVASRCRMPKVVVGCGGANLCERTVTEDKLKLRSADGWTRKGTDCHRDIDLATRY